jgi:hypothetical protein
MECVEGSARSRTHLPLIRGPSRSVGVPTLILLRDAVEISQHHFRAEVAEAGAREAKEALALVEEANRKRLLCENPDVDSKLTGAA